MNQRKLVLAVVASLCAIILIGVDIIHKNESNAVMENNTNYSGDMFEEDAIEYDVDGDGEKHVEVKQSVDIGDSVYEMKDESQRPGFFERMRQAILSLDTPAYIFMSGRRNVTYNQDQGTFTYNNDNNESDGSEVAFNDNYSGDRNSSNTESSSVTRSNTGQSTTTESSDNSSSGTKSNNTTTSTPEKTEEVAPSATQEIVVEGSNTLEDTMYNYKKAGISSSTNRVSSKDYISVNDYGVVANDGKDYSSKITKAIIDANSKGKYLYFPEGTYYVKNVKIENSKFVRICGAGEKTVLKTANDAKGSNWDIALGIYYSSNIVIRNITFDGNNKKVAGNLSVGVLQLRLDNCSTAEVYGCRFQNNNNGNLNVVGHGDNIRIYYCDFLNSDCSVIVMPGYLTNSFICNNYIDGQDWEYSEPISLYYSEKDSQPNREVYICGNNIRNHTAAAGGIFITFPSEDIYIQSNYVYRCGAAIGSGSRRQDPNETKGPSDIFVKDNIIDSPTWHGIQLLYAENWNIQYNTFKNIPQGCCAFILNQCKNNTIMNNTINGSNIMESKCSGNSFYNNK
ncbi:MAG: glycoside hydrolase family 55 protein [Lachnospiraceae bacterium]|nr:glycoside hydrolase family 55 protein [Lachnospiraceae bacterium]